MHIRKWGNNLAVRIPITLASELDIRAGTPVELTIANGALVVTPRERPKYRLRDLLKGYKRRRAPREIDFGPPVGREIID